MEQTTQEQSPSGLSIAALITGILGMGIVPIILGAIDMSRIKSGMSSEKGKGFDIAGIVLGSIGIVAGIIITIVWVVLLAGQFYYFR
ncbi:MAG: hypothetical protein A2Z35_05260 [Actinobacteria bacterium RBG_19FT_COMBO_36_27]|nr:MAG: hypothetical protein A2Z35_05260 [Actinobacteria bacterium RBG_19FT_COMBO_36_27]